MSSLFRSAPAAAEKSATGAAIPSSGFLPTLGATPSDTGLNISQGTAMAVSAVYGCVSILAQDVARCTPRLFRRRSDGSRVEDKDHPLNKIFRRPNGQQTWFEFMEQMGGAFHLRGNAYAAKKYDARGAIAALIPINPDAVLVMESWNGEIFYNVNRLGLWQIAMLRDFPTALAEDDVFHLRGLSFNALVGLSTIGMARNAIGVAMGLELQTSRHMANGARPSMVLEAPGKLSEASAKRLGQQFRDAFSGIRNTGGVPVLEDGVKANQLTLTSVDMEFMAQRNYQLLDVARFYRVPPHKLGTEHRVGANLVQMDQDYVNNTVMPHLHRWEQKFDQAFGLAEQDLEVDMDETVLLRADVQTRYNIARVGLLSGFLKPNEIRRGEDLDPVEGGDEVFRPMNMAALGSDATGTAPDGAGHPGAQDGDTPGVDNVPTRVDDGGKASARRKYDDDQPRDDHGRWSTGGGGGSHDAGSEAGGGGGIAEEEDFRGAIKGLAAGAVLIAGSALVAAMAPESLAVVGIAAIAQAAGSKMLADVAMTAAKHILARLGLDGAHFNTLMNGVEDAVSTLGGKAATDQSQAAKALKGLIPIALDQSVADLIAYVDEHAPDAPLKAHKEAAAALREAAEKCKAAIAALETKSE